MAEEELPGFTKKLESFYPETLKRIRRRARLIGSPAKYACSRRGNGFGGLQELPLGFDSARPRHYDKVSAADHEISGMDNSAGAVASVSYEIKARELPVPLGVGGHRSRLSGREDR